MSQDWHIGNRCVPDPRANADSEPLIGAAMGGILWRGWEKTAPAWRGTFSLMSIGSEKYVALTTDRKGRTPRSTAVWIAELEDGQVGLITPASSWKVKTARQ